MTTFLTVFDMFILTGSTILSRFHGFAVNTFFKIEQVWNQ